MSMLGFRVCPQPPNPLNPDPTPCWPQTWDEASWCPAVTHSAPSTALSTPNTTRCTWWLACAGFICKQTWAPMCRLHACRYMTCSYMFLHVMYRPAWTLHIGAHVCLPITTAHAHLNTRYTAHTLRTPNTPTTDNRQHHASSWTSLIHVPNPRPARVTIAPPEVRHIHGCTQQMCSHHW